MISLDAAKIRLAFLRLAMGLLMTIPSAPAAGIAAEVVPPVADAGLPRYAAQEPVILDGTGSYDPDSSGPLSYAWTQVGGPLVEVSGADTATPTVHGFVQTDSIQKCEFELVVSDGELTSPPDTVKVVIVPSYPLGRLPELRNEFFDPDKPTIICFRGGDGTYGAPEGNPYRLATDPVWLSSANIISFRAGYEPDSIAAPRRTYYRCGDMIIVYLSSVAPDYKQAIQTIGHSTGGLPAMDVGLHLNLTYKDRRYAVNRVTLLDVGNLYWRDPGSEDTTICQFLASSVDGEQCWIDDYWWGELHVFTNILNVQFPVIGHYEVRYWYDASLSSDNMNQFNNGVVAGAYWSVIGPGKNLQLAPTGDYTYVFKWPSGLLQEEPIELYDESSYPGRLPEPITLVGPPDGATVDASGAVLTCEESENAVGYQLLFGADPYDMVYLYSDTPGPPDAVSATFPFEETWWTVRAYDEYGSTIHADPVLIRAESVEPQTIENLATGRTYASIQQAINDARPGDEIVIGAGLCHYQENIDFKGKNLTLRSANPDDPAGVAATVIDGRPVRPVITMSGSLDGTCVLAGLTITGGTVGLACRDAAPTIRNCTIGGSGPTAIEFWQDYEPVVIDCTLIGAIEGISDPTLAALWRLDETEGRVAHDSAGDAHGTVIGVPSWRPEAGRVDGALEFNGMTFVAADSAVNPAGEPFSVFAWVKGGAPGQVVVSQQAGANWLMADALDGSLMTDLRAGGRSPVSLGSQTVIADGEWHRAGFTWDGASRRLYVDDVLVAEDTQIALGSSTGKVLMGCGADMVPDTFFSGLIDDIRIYSRAVRP